jgi:hypothetical protein
VQGGPDQAKLTAQKELAALSADKPVARP